ncbi:hypothetical protein T484DRAFT_1977829 [Baffinella frigidus]|nr:hypothetical protein T484DRAFT_1977829 [Cryptophyta sp. CCMP2293]
MRGLPAQVRDLDGGRGGSAVAASLRKSAVPRNLGAKPRGGQSSAPAPCLGGE